MAYITAAETVLLFATASGASDNTQRTRITFDMELAGKQVGGDLVEVAIWWRRNTEAWHKLDFPKVGINAHPVNKGAFWSWNVAPGDVLQYRMYNDTVQPGYVPDTVANETQPHSGAMVWHTEIFGLLNMSRNTPDKLKNSYKAEKRIGGTYYGLRYQSKGINTNILFEISQQEPIYGLPNYLRFTDPQRLSWLGLGAQQYDFNLMPLQPGTTYNVLIRYSDESGNWFMEQEKITTLRRQVVLKGDSIVVDNDGDPFADGEASFNIQFGQGATNTAIFFMGHDDFKVHNGQNLPLGTLYKLDTSLPLVDQVWPLPEGPVEKTFGPYGAGDGLPDITVYAAGTEYDGLFESDEHAATGGGFFATLTYPTGPDETVTDKTASITAVPDEDDNFQFTLNYRYSITYL